MPIGATTVAPGVWTLYSKRTGSIDEKQCQKCSARTSLPAMHGWFWQWAPDHQSTVSVCASCMIRIRKNNNHRAETLNHLSANGCSQQRGLAMPEKCGKCSAPRTSFRNSVDDRGVPVVSCRVCGWDWFLINTA